MNIVKNKNGITLIALVITIIILLILMGVTLIIANNLIIDKAIMAYSKTTEVILKEKIELAWIDAEAAYRENMNTKEKSIREDYLKEIFFENLKNLEEFSEINITGDIAESITVHFKYQNEAYSFSISPEGKANLVYLLKGNVEVGDYIEYPIEYYDVYTDEYYTAQNGWMVLDDGVMPGTAGCVRITSTHIPAKWYYDSMAYADNITAVAELINNFENLDLFYTINPNNENAEGVNEPIKGSYFKLNSIAEKVTAITLSDLNNAYNQVHGTKRTSDDVSLLDEKDDLFHIRDPGAYYWLATSKTDSSTKMYYVSFDGIKDEVDLRLGIRPVIYLDENQSGILNSNIWEIIN